MVIVFYDANAEKLYICTENEKTRIVEVDDPNIMDYIPNDDILYVQNAHFVTKSQFSDWLAGDMDFAEPDGEREVSRLTGLFDSEYRKGPYTQLDAAPKAGRLYIHPTANDSVRIEDIPEFPEGIQLNGKYHFIPVDKIGEDNLAASRHFQLLRAKGKLEIVDEVYVQANKHKTARKMSPAQAALDSILVPADIKAEAAAGGAWHAKPSSDEPIEILVDG